MSTRNLRSNTHKRKHPEPLNEEKTGAEVQTRPQKRNSSPSPEVPATSRVEIPQEDAPPKNDIPPEPASNIQPFPLMKLPRELRNHIYAFHLENALSKSCQCDHRDYGEAFGTSMYNLSRTFAWLPIQGTPYPGFYQPVFVRQLPSNNPLFLDPQWWSPDFEARECRMPALTQLRGTQACAEAWELFGTRLVVDVDALNRFQRWYLEVMEGWQRVAVRRLYIGARARYFWHATGQRDYIESKEYPAFVIRIDAGGRELTVCARFALEPAQLVILTANLDLLLAEPFSHKSRLDNEDIVEAMFAFHGKFVASSRQSLVTGPLKKGGVRWCFRLEDGDIKPVLDGLDDNSLRTVKRAAERGQVFKHIIYRRSAAGGNHENVVN